MLLYEWTREKHNRADAVSFLCDSWNCLLHSLVCHFEPTTLSYLLKTNSSNLCKPPTEIAAQNKRILEALMINKFLQNKTETVVIYFSGLDYTITTKFRYFQWTKLYYMEKSTVCNFVHLCHRVNGAQILPLLGGPEACFCVIHT